MFINFLHSNRQCSAYIVYETESGDSITAYILDFNSELGYEIIFKKADLSVWDTTENIKIKFPLTYNALCTKLTEVFPGSTFIINDEICAEEFAA